MFAYPFRSTSVSQVKFERIRGLLLTKIVDWFLQLRLRIVHDLTIKLHIQRMSRITNQVWDTSSYRNNFIDRIHISNKSQV